MIPLVVAENLPWWLAAPLAQLLLLLAGIAIEKTYVNRVTPFTGAMAVFVHVLVSGESSIWTGLYLDVGLLLGLFGVWAYAENVVVNRPEFKLLAYFAYAPLTVVLVVLLPSWLLLPALVVGAVVNFKLVEEPAPAKPYYFGHPEEERDEGGADVSDVITVVKERVQEFQETVEGREASQ